MKKTIRLMLIALAVMLLASCNADILSRVPGSYQGDGSSNETGEIFNGEAPKNVWASPAYYSDRIIVSFDSVPGADYYEIYKAEASRSADDGNYMALDWVKVIYDVASSSRTRIDYVDTNIDARISSEKLYYYTVRAGNYAAGIDGKIEADFSDPVRGWTLNPPTSLEVSQGISEEYIELKWSQVNKVKGYRIFYSNNKDADANVWVPMMDGLIPAPVSEKTLIAKFTPPKEFMGKDLYFAVSSVSFKDAESSRSGIRNGYTFIPGAPIAPEGLKASNGASTRYIDVSWTIPKKENLSAKGYTWEVSRYTSDTDPELLVTFNSKTIDELIATGKAPVGLTKDEDNGRYSYRDTKDLQPGIDYEYSVRATAMIMDEDGNEVPAIGIASTKKGYIIGPNDKITEKKTTFPSGGSNGGFSFTISEAPEGFREGDTWQYRIYGRNSVDGKPGEWRTLFDLPVVAGPVKVEVAYEPASPVNEFSYTVIDNNGDESKSYADVFGRAIVTELAPAPDVSILNIMSNTYDSTMKASSAGVYPVKAVVNYDGSTYSAFNIEALKAATPNPKTESAGMLRVVNGEERILAGLSPENVAEKWSYRIQGIDVFGRPSAWSDTVTGYGALTGKALINFVERYAMKPWEFVGEAGFPDRLNSKWSPSSGTNAGNLHAMIDKHGLGSIGKMTVAGDFHGGSLYYDSYANGFAGDVVFKFTNFGELEEVWSNGTYKMASVSASGSGDSVSGKLEVSGMYPCTIDFSALKVRNYAFSGNYKVTFTNGMGTVDVSSAH